MADTLTIQQVASHTGLSTYTLRYYERAGLISSINRADSGHRRYDRNDLDWITFLRCLRRTGMSIQQMQAFAELRRQGPKTLMQRHEFLETYRQEVIAQIREREEILRLTDKKLAILKQQIKATLPDS